MAGIEEFTQVLEGIALWIDKVTISRLLGAIFILILGRWLAQLGRYWIKRTLRHHLTRSASLATFLGEVTYYVLILFTILLALSVLGVPTASIITLVAAVIIIVIIILQPSFKNFSAGAFFNLYQPFKIGDLIQTAGILGYVKEANLNYSTLRTLDNRIVTIPNSQVELTNIINYSTADIIRAEMEFYITYSDDYLKAKQILMEIITNDSRVLKDPPARVLVLDLDNRGVKIGVWPYVKADDYLDVQWDTPEQVKLAFDQAGITIPVLQHQMYLYYNENRVVSLGSGDKPV